MGRTTSSLVRLNTKLEAMNLEKVPSPADGSTITDGFCIVRDAAGKAVLATTTSPVPMLVFQGNNRSDTYDLQNSPMAELDANQGITLETGGITVLRGPCPASIGLPIANFGSGASTAAPGDVVSVNSSGQLIVNAAASVDQATVTTAGVAFGIALRIAGYVSHVDGNIVWMTWLGFTIPVYGNSVS